MSARAAASSYAAMSSRIEVSSSIGADTNVVPSTPAPSRDQQVDVATHRHNSMHNSKPSM